tara:strand:+ start:9637 stop:9843 length:207 start_codon:yes stop_codon:yes gene_type:complete
MELHEITKVLLDDHGYSQKRLADAIKATGVRCSQPTIWRILNVPGFDPVYSVGEAIKRIYAEKQDVAA